MKTLTKPLVFHCFVGESEFPSYCIFGMKTLKTKRMCFHFDCAEETEFPLAARCNAVLAAKDVNPFGNTIEIVLKDEQQRADYTRLRLNATRVQDDFVSCYILCILCYILCYTLYL